MVNPRHYSDGGRALTVAELQADLSAASPSALLVPKYVIWRAIKNRDPGGGLAHVSHDAIFTIDRKTFLSLVDSDELSELERSQLGSQVFLIAKPDPEELATMSWEQARIFLWRNLFHAMVHGAMESLIEDGRLSPSQIRAKIHAIGQVEFDEARHVLRQDKSVLPPGDDTNIYIEFVATYLELKFFDPDQLPRYFPTVVMSGRAETVFADDLNFRSLLQIARPGGVSLETPEQLLQPQGPAELPPRPSPRMKARRIKQARKAADKGNSVRAAIMLMKASRFVSGDADLMDLRQQASEHLEALASRIGDMLDTDDHGVAAWRSSLAELLVPASRGFWPPAARLLYELQKACVTHEKELFSIDLVEWASRKFRGPVRRSLPIKRTIMIVRYFRAAIGRVESVPIRDECRKKLSRLIADALETRQDKLRKSLSGKLADAIKSVGISPDNRPEDISLNKMADELVDRLIDRGYIAIGDLRDELSRGNLKLPDVRSLGEFIGGPLLALDRRLPDIMDATYHRAEFYVCWLMRISAMAFGTRVGRFLTRFVALPLLGAYVSLVGLTHLVNLVLGFSGLGEVSLMTSTSFAFAAIYIAMLVNVVFCRRASLVAIRSLGKSLRWITVTLPLRIYRHQIVRAILLCWPVRMIQNVIVRPGLLACAAWLVARLKYSDPATLGNVFIAALVVSSILLNCRAGRRLQEFTADWVRRTWRIIHTNILLGFLTWMWDAFKFSLEMMERLFYAVDQYFRFRQGAGRFSMIVKPILGLVWFFVSYVFRMFINVFVEPQINPIKHFPVVTVSHKILLTYEPAFAELLIDAGVDKYAAHTTATGIIGSIPGLFGFLVWELMGNWRIFESNRRADLHHVTIGSHGESMIRFMKPGFHSGTLPKIFTRMRRASRRWQGDIRTSKLGKYRRSIRHVQENISHFVRRELLASLDGSNIWGSMKVDQGRILVGTKRVAIELLCPEISSVSQWIFFEEQSGWLLADIRSDGWIDSLSPSRRRIMELALAGWFKLAGVDIIRGRIRRMLAPLDATYDICDDGLAVWPGTKDTMVTEFATEVLYRLDRERVSFPQIRCGKAGDVKLPDIDLDLLLFVRQRFEWSKWVALWRARNLDELNQLDLPPGLNVLDR